MIWSQENSHASSCLLSVTNYTNYTQWKPSKWNRRLCVLRPSSVVSPPFLLSCDAYGWTTFSNTSYAFRSLLLLCILLLPFLWTLRIKASVSSEGVRRLLCVFSFHVFIICSVWRVIFRIFHPAAIVSCLHITLHSIYCIWAKIQLLNSFPPFTSFQLFSISCRYWPMHFFSTLLFDFIINTYVWPIRVFLL